MSLRVLRLLRSYASLRLFHTTKCLPKGKSQRLKVRSGGGGESGSGRETKTTSRRESVAQMRAAASRARWEAERLAEEKVIGVHPSADVNVFFAEQFERRQWSIGDALEMLREAASPEMFNCLENPVYAKMTLNHRTKKSNKFIAKLETSVTLPHQLDFFPKRRIIVLTNDKAVAIECTSQWGAVAAGGADIVGRLEVGGFHWDEYDDVVAHPDFTDSLHKVRKILRNRLPTAKNGRIGEDVIELLKSQQTSILLNSTPVEGVPEINELQVVLGQLSWADSHLEDNFRSYLRAVEEAKSTRVNGDVVERVDLLCPPCDEIFRLEIGKPSDGVTPTKVVIEKEDEKEAEEEAVPV